MAASAFQPRVPNLLKALPGDRVLSARRRMCSRCALRHHPDVSGRLVIQLKQCNGAFAQDVGAVAQLNGMPVKHFNPYARARAVDTNDWDAARLSTTRANPCHASSPAGLGSWTRVAMPAPLPAPPIKSIGCVVSGSRMGALTLWAPSLKGVIVRLADLGSILMPSTAAAAVTRCSVGPLQNNSNGPRDTASATSEVIIEGDMGPMLPFLPFAACLGRSRRAEWLPLV